MAVSVNRAHCCDTLGWFEGMSRLSLNEYLCIYLFFKGFLLFSWLWLLFNLYLYWLAYFVIRFSFGLGLVFHYWNKGTQIVTWDIHPIWQASTCVCSSWATAWLPPCVYVVLCTVLCILAHCSMFVVTLQSPTFMFYDSHSLFCTQSLFICQPKAISRLDYKKWINTYASIIRIIICNVCDM